MAKSTIHIRKDELMTRCGLAWAINYIGNCDARDLNKYRSRDDCSICPTCDADARAYYDAALARIEDRIAEQVESVHGIVTAAMIQARDNCRSILGIDDGS